MNFMSSHVLLSHSCESHTLRSHRTVLGSTAELPCQLSHDKAVPIEVSWVFNDFPIKYSNRVQQLADGTLRIEQARNTDVGTYTCKAVFPGGSYLRTARLDVIELPHSPLNVKTELNVAGGLVNVSWSPPFDGNSPIVRYVVETRVTRNGDGVSGDDFSYNDPFYGWTRYPANISASQRFALLTNLRPAMTYQFRVLAVNTVGEGPPSAPSHPPITLPAQPPSAPPIGVVGAARSSTSIVIQWQPPPPEAHNGVLYGYLVRYKLAGYVDTQWYYKNVTNAAQLHCTLEDLIVWRNYEIQVGAYNEMGTGAYSPSIFIRTKEGKPASSPNNVQAKALNSTAILITWNQTDPQLINGINQGYKVQAFVMDSKRSKPSSPPAKILAKEIIVTPHPIQEKGQEAIFTDLEPFTEYIITVLCFTSAGDGPPNDPPILVTTNEDLPETVSSFKFGEVKDTTIELQWTPPDKINGKLLGYALRYCAVVTGMTDCHWIHTEYSVNTTSTIINGVMPDTNYKFEIKAVTRVGPGPPVTASVKSAVAPVEIGPLVFSDITMSRLKVSWSPPVMNDPNPNNQLIGYQVVYETSLGKDYGKQVKQKIVDNFLIVSGLKERVTYTFKVRAETTAGLGPERIGNITTGPQPGSPPPPLDVNLTQTLTSVRLKWSNPPVPPSDPIIGYLIEGKQIFGIDDGNGLSSPVSEEDSQWQPIVSLRNGPQTEYDLSFNHLSPSSKYTLRMMSVNSRGISEPAFPVLSSSSATKRIGTGGSTSGGSSSSGSSHQPTTIIITPSHLAQLRARLPFYKEPWFVILCASMTVVFTIMVMAILCVQSKSYQYKKEASAMNKSPTGSRDALSEEGFGLDDGPYASGLELRQNPNVRHSMARSTGGLNESAAAAAAVRCPPRPAPGSLSYSDDEDYCETEAKDSNFYASSGDSLTEKPSETSSSGPDSETDQEDQGAHFVNHYANVNDTLKKGHSDSWKKQGRPYVVRPPRPPSSRERDRAAGEGTSRQKPSRPVPVPPRHDLMYSSVGTSAPGASASTSSLNHHHNHHSHQQQLYQQQHPGPSGSHQAHPSSSSHHHNSHYSSQPLHHHQQQPHPQQGGPVPPPSYMAALAVTNDGEDDLDNSSSSTNGAVGNNNNNHNNHGGSHSTLNGGRLVISNIPRNRQPLPGFSSFV